MLDFLKEIVEPIPDPSAGGTIDLDSEEASANSENISKKKRNASKGKAAATKQQQSAKADAESEKPAPKKRRRKKADVVDQTMMDVQEDFGESDVVNAGAFATNTDSVVAKDSWREDEDWR
jgi:hypothetical protein